ncbi:hypothetical protein C8D87_1011193 [Lentzea atacamensis]|uniref:Uncharacterized protein n=1 Tax=Lentzea atacamensis TaxID=531938 RepID=A0ABX9EI80_9PSEU|nr:hypothetical protein C8D87_1011193 [Lentzea atacamensis]
MPFVALVALQITMRLSSPVPPLIASWPFGALLLIGSDLVARSVLPDDLPSASSRGPFLVHLLVRANLRRAA